MSETKEKKWPKIRVTNEAKKAAEEQSKRAGVSLLQWASELILSASRKVQK
jgi:predicted HicB family RNase H-like nuclease